MAAIIATLLVGIVAIPVLSLLVIMVWDWLDREEGEVSWRELESLRCNHCRKRWDDCDCFCE